MLYFSTLRTLLLLAIFSVPLLAQTRIIPHLTRPDGGFTTQIFLENTSVNRQNYTLTPFDSQGNPLDQATGTIDAQTTLSMAARELFNSTEAAHFLIEGDGVQATAAYRAAEGPGSPAHVLESDEQGTRYRLLAGEWSAVFDGFAAVNTGSVSADVWVVQKSFDGTALQSEKALEGLNPMAKGLYVIGGPAGSAFQESSEVYYEVYSEQPLALTPLRGTVPGAPVGYLWTNEAEIKGRAASKRDEQGVWFIEDGSFYDVFEAMGYNVAFDRLFQMELLKRTTRGTLAQLIGPNALNQDIFARTVSYSNEELEQMYLDLDDESKTMIKAYVDGVNRRISEVNGDASIYPLEFQALQLPRVDFWTSYDVMVFISSLLQQFDPGSFGSNQLSNAAMLQELAGKFSPETAAGMFEDFRYINDPDAPTMIPAREENTKTTPASPDRLPMIRDDIDFGRLAHEMNSQREANLRFLESINARVKMGSYAWVVSGDKTTSGNPIIYSGPQMGFSTPAITTEGSIRGGGIEVSGMTVPGIPSIIVGRTPHHAWSMQVGHAHTTDLYLEPDSVLDEPHRIETFKVAGSADVEVPIYRTVHGPVLNQSPVISWKYSHWGREFNLSGGNLAMIRAQSMDEFGEALQALGVSQHFCYADRDGNIAYWMSGHDPIRPPGDYRFPQGTLTTQEILEYDADIIRPFPHDRNTPRGWYAGWNNKSEAAYDNSPQQTYGPFHRALVIQNYLSAKDLFSFEELNDLALNIASTDASVSNGGNPWLLVDSFFTAAVTADNNESRQQALDLLEQWDGHFIAGGEEQWVAGMDRSDGWLLMDLWIEKTLNLSFDDELSQKSRSASFNTLLHGINPEAAIQNNYDWFTNLSDSSAPQTWQAIVVQALDETLAQLGPTTPWGTGLRGQINFVHPLLGQSIWATPFASRSTYAQIVEMGENGPVRIQSMFPLGESGFITGTPFSPIPDSNFFSMTPFFDNFQPRTFPLFD